MGNPINPQKSQKLEKTIMKIEKRVSTVLVF